MPPLLERVVFARLELVRRFECGSLYPNVAENDRQTWLSNAWVTNRIKDLLPWDYAEDVVDTAATESTADQMLSAMKRLEEYKKIRANRRKSK